MQPLVHVGAVDQGSYGVAPYTAYNGSTNYSYRPAGALRGSDGFTAGGWFQATSGDTLMGVWQASANQCWRLFMNSLAPTLYVSSTGANSFTVAGAAVTSGAWTHVIGRYTPSTEISIFVNGVKAVNTTSIPASLFEPDINFTIGANHSVGELLTGKASMCFFCCEPLDDSYMTILYQMSRHLYGA